jgi:hypothetical protein
MKNYDQKDTEELQSNLTGIDILNYLKELSHYKHEVVMQKLNEEFALKQDENVMEICKEILEKYENGTLEE